MTLQDERRALCALTIEWRIHWAFSLIYSLTHSQQTSIHGCRGRNMVVSGMARRGGRWGYLTEQLGHDSGGRDLWEKLIKQHLRFRHRSYRPWPSPRRRYRPCLQTWGLLHQRASLQRRP